MLGRRVWRGQTIEDVPPTRKHWRARENRVWRREAELFRPLPDAARSS
jgi:hypothetical protein